MSFRWALGIEVGSSARAASALNCICLRLVASPITAVTAPYTAPAWVFRLGGALVAPFTLSDSTWSNTYTVSLAGLHGVLVLSRLLASIFAQVFSGGSQPLAISVGPVLIPQAEWCVFRKMPDDSTRVPRLPSASSRTKIKSKVTAAHKFSMSNPALSDTWVGFPCPFYFWHQWFL